MTELKDNSNRAKTVVTMFYLLLGISVISILSGVYEYMTLDQYDYWSEEFSISDFIISLIGLAQIAINITLIVVFINWFRRAYANLSRIGVGHLSHTDLHAAWCWFVPFLNLFRPYQIMKEIWEETQHQIKKLNSGFVINFSSSVIGTWWAFYLISNFVANYATRKSFRAYSVEELRESTLLILFSDFIDIPAAILAIIVVKKISNIEGVLQHELEATDFGNQDVDVNLEEG